jgi:mRNA-degrading endonuclease toxin of MazEF toxin-antitoxin module
MSLLRGDTILANDPLSSGLGDKRQPAFFVQTNRDNRRLKSPIAAQIMLNFGRGHVGTHRLIEAASTKGQAAGLLHDSVVSCHNLATISENRIDRKIGALLPSVMADIDACLKSALDLP